MSQCNHLQSNQTKKVEVKIDENNVKALYPKFEPYTPFTAKGKMVTRRMVRLVFFNEKAYEEELLAKENLLKLLSARSFVEEQKTENGYMIAYAIFKDFQQKRLSFLNDRFFYKKANIAFADSTARRSNEKYVDLSSNPLSLYLREFMSKQQKKDLLFTETQEKQDAINQIKEDEEIEEENSDRNKVSEIREELEGEKKKEQSLNKDKCTIRKEEGASKRSLKRKNNDFKALELSFERKLKYTKKTPHNKLIGIIKGKEKSQKMEMKQQREKENINYQKLMKMMKQLSENQRVIVEWIKGHHGYIAVGLLQGLTTMNIEQSHILQEVDEIFREAKEGEFGADLTVCGYQEPVYNEPYQEKEKNVKLNDFCEEDHKQLDNLKKDEIFPELLDDLGERTQIMVETKPKNVAPIYNQNYEQEQANEFVLRIIDPYAFS